MTICILGRQPAIGLSELESRFGAAKVVPIGEIAAKLDVAADDIPVHLLGGVVKIATMLKTLPDTDWNKALQAALHYLPQYTEGLPEGKFKLGISTYDLTPSLQAQRRAALELKKALRATGRSVRIVPNTAPQLNSAQVLHNRLTSELGCELLFIRDGHKTQLAQTTYVQDIDDYARRDFGRPKRDAFVGMLPPKLAQTMLNLAQVQPGDVVLDPFCGTGVVLQEAALMGCRPYGSDLSERMVRYTRDNLNWLKDIYHLEFDALVETADATIATWRPPINRVVGEAYLGKPLTTLPPPAELETIIRQCNDIASPFLANLRPQLAPGCRCVIAVPAWFNGKGFLHLPFIDYLEKMGYNRVSFQHVAPNQLIYHRNDQIVARELLVLTAKELH